MKLKSLACGWEHEGQVLVPASTSFPLPLVLLPSGLPPLAASTPCSLSWTHFRGTKWFLHKAGGGAAQMCCWSKEEAELGSWLHAFPQEGITSAPKSSSQTTCQPSSCQKSNK